jgi:hypothetical protein
MRWPRAAAPAQGRRPGPAVDSDGEGCDAETAAGESAGQRLDLEPARALSCLADSEAAAAAHCSAGERARLEGWVMLLNTPLLHNSVLYIT